MAEQNGITNGGARTADGQGPNGQNGEENTQPALPPVVINAQYVKDLSFENPNAPHSLLPGQPQPQVGLAVDVNIQRLNENTFEVVLDLKAEARLGERVAFLAEVSYAGVFTLNGVQAEHQRPFLLIEGPRLLFPFARNIIADVTRDGGYPPLLVAPIDFGDLYRRQAAAQAEVGTA